MANPNEKRSLEEQFKDILDKKVKLMQEGMNDVVAKGYALILAGTPVVTGNLLDSWRFPPAKLTKKSWEYKLENLAPYAYEVNEKYKGKQGMSPTGGIGSPRGFVGPGLHYIETNLGKELEVIWAE